MRIGINVCVCPLMIIAIAKLLLKRKQLCNRQSYKMQAQENLSNEHKDQGMEQANAKFL